MGKAAAWAMIAPSIVVPPLPAGGLRHRFLSRWRLHSAATANNDRSCNITGKVGAKDRCPGVTPCHVTVTPAPGARPLFFQRLFALLRIPQGPQARSGMPGRLTRGDDRGSGA